MYVNYDLGWLPRQIPDQRRQIHLHHLQGGHGHHLHQQGDPDPQLRLLFL